MKRKIAVLACALLSLRFPFPPRRSSQRNVTMWVTSLLATRLDATKTLSVKECTSLEYVEEQNLVIDWKFASGKTSLFPDLAANLARLNVDAIIGQGVGATRAAKQATSTIPIVMSNADDDPVRLGLVTSLARPGVT